MISGEQTYFLFGIGASNYDITSNNAFGLVFMAIFYFLDDITLTMKDEKSTYRMRDLSLVYDFQIGAGYRIINQNKFKLPVTMGFHLFSLEGATKDSSTVSHDLSRVSFGLGASIAAEYHFNNIFYAFGRVQAAFDFVTMTNRVKFTGVNIGGKMAYYIDGYEYTALSLHTNIVPAIGMGIKLDGLKNKPQ